MDDSQQSGSQPTDQSASPAPIDPVAPVADDTSINPAPVEDTTAPAEAPVVPDLSDNTSEAISADTPPADYNAPANFGAPTEGAEATENEPTVAPNNEEEVPPTSPNDNGAL